LPAEVTILRDHHPLDGKVLKVMGWMQRNGILHLTLLLPDGTRSLIPAAWTNLKLTAADNSPSPSSQSLAPPPIGSVLDLLRARTIIDALIQRLDCIEPAVEEDKRETTNGFLDCHQTKTRRARSLGKSNPRRTDNGHSRSGTANQQSSFTGKRHNNSGEELP